LLHPVRSAFAGAITIGLMLVAAGLAPYGPGLASAIWLLAVAGHVGIGIWLLRLMLLAPREPALFAPPLIIPLVGHAVAPIVGVRLGFGTLSWMLFGAGLMLWLFLQPLLLARLATGPALPPRLRPTLVIFLAPPAVTCLAAAAVTEGFGPLPLALLGMGVVLALVLLTFLPEFARAPFAMSWWGWTFPTAAFSAAVTGAARAHPLPGISLLAWVVLLAASAILVIVLLATWRAHARGELLVPE
ncbi:MAG: C4-dicarboxylate ABC transporter, partial [Rhodovarius sp.]|nr:C4-dicarboxylate ABC transporter [Rhodovarius sp.]